MKLKWILKSTNLNFTAELLARDSTFQIYSNAINIDRHCHPMPLEFLEAPVDHGYLLPVIKACNKWFFHRSNRAEHFKHLRKYQRSTPIPWWIHHSKDLIEKSALENLPLEVVLFWLLRLLLCEKVGIFEIVSELCNPSNSCNAMESFLISTPVVNILRHVYKTWQRQGNSTITWYRSAPSLKK